VRRILRDDDTSRKRVNAPLAVRHRFRRRRFVTRGLRPKRRDKTSRSGQLGPVSAWHAVVIVMFNQTFILTKPRAKGIVLRIAFPPNFSQV